MSIQNTSPWLARIPERARYPRLTTNITTDVVVIGGGIAGVSAAYFLTRAGRKVVLLEANHLGTGETGFTTAFLTSSVDYPLSLLRATFGDAHIRTVRQIGEETISLVEDIVTHEALSCGFHRLDALAIGFSPETIAHLKQETEALRAAGGSATFLNAAEIRSLTGVAAAGGIRIPRQAAFDSRHFLLGLAERCQNSGGQIFEETRGLGLEPLSTVTVTTPAGTVTAQHVVLATGLFQGLAKAQNALFRQMITYVSAGELRDAAHGGRLPDALYWDVDEPFHYMRFLNGWFFVGGEDRPLREASKAGEVPWISLEAFARTFIPDGEWTPTYRWRGQILETADALPVVGVPRGDDPRVLLASGFGGNGMTFGTRSGKIVADLVTGNLEPEAHPFRFGRETLRLSNANSEATKAQDEPVSRRTDEP